MGALNAADTAVKGMVSVVIPAYNHERYVAETIRSVLSQQYEPLEVIVIDDGSTDGTGSILDGLDDPRVTVLHQENAGTGPTLNRGVSLARGEFVSLLNSDDLYGPGRLERLVRHLREHPEHDLVFTRVTLVDAEGVPHSSGADHDWLLHTYDYFKEHPNLQLGLLFSDFACTSSNYCFRRTLTERIGPFRDLRYANDYDFLLRAARRDLVGFVDEPLLMYRKHDSCTLNESLQDGQVDFWLEVSWIFADYLRHKETLEHMDLAELWRVLDLHNHQNCEIVLFYLLHFLKHPEADPETVLHDPAIRAQLGNYIERHTLPVVASWHAPAQDYETLYKEVAASRAYQLANGIAQAAKGRDVRRNLRAAWRALLGAQR